MTNTLIPTFSILVPTYNQADYLAKALDSLLSQTDSDWEAIVVNDGSIDHTYQLLNSYAARDSRIRPFHKDNGGTATALNKALKEARGEWICWLSSDDLFEPEKLALHREWICRFPEARFFFTYFKLLVESTGNLEDRHDLWGPLPERPYQTLGLLRRNFISGITTCVHRDVFKELGGFDESLRYGQDYDRWLWITSRYPGIFIPVWTVVNRNHAGQGSEAFPQACYFDTAKAGIRFLGCHTYPQLLPLMDTKRFDVALDAFAAGLKIAADSDAFLYWMGVHPALLYCIYDWLSKNEDEQHKRGTELLWNRLETFAAQEMLKHRGNFGSLWRHALITARLRPMNIRRVGITPETVGRCYHQHLRANCPDMAPGLVRYFKQFMDGEDLDQIEPNLTGVEIAVTAPFEAGMTEVEASCWAAQLLSAAGCAVTLVTPGEPSVDYQGGALILRVPNEGILSHCIKSIRPWDVCAAFHGAPVLPASRTVLLSASGNAIEGCTAIPQRGESLEERTSAFLAVFAQRERLSTSTFPKSSLAQRFLRKFRRGFHIAIDSAGVRKVRFFIGTKRQRLKRWVVEYARKNAAWLGAWIIAKFCPGNEAFDAFKRKGFFLLCDHYYLPLPDFQDLSETFMESQSEMAGIELKETQMVDLIEHTLALYNAEFRTFPITPPTTEITRFYLINGGYMAVDGNLYYGLVRHLKPRRIIETGCGMSTLLCSEALHRNEQAGQRTDYTCIEPYPQTYIVQNPFLKVSEFIRSKIQHVRLEIFEELRENDILFIDTTHALRMGGDVQFIYCEILPRLNPGVYVHIHDISLPRQYPRIYHEEYRYFWNEQYLLQAYLSHNAKADVVWAGNWLRLRDEYRFNRLFPEFLTMRQYYPESEPTAFWFRTK